MIPRLKLGDASGLPALILMTDPERLPDPLEAIRRLPRGSAVVFRHYGEPDRADLARRLAAACRRRHVLFLVAGDARLAAAIRADGIHLPEALARRGPGVWQLWKRPGWLVTAAAHSPTALCRAARCGADAVMLSPIFPTASHSGAHPLGGVRFAAWRRESPLPVYGLGGITKRNARRLSHSGAAGIAAIGGLS